MSFTPIVSERIIANDETIIQGTQRVLDWGVTNRATIISHRGIQRIESNGRANSTTISSRSIYITS